MSKTKILHLCQSTGGVKTYVAQVIEYADRTKFDFVIIAPADILFEAFCTGHNTPYYPVNLHRGGNPLKVITSFIKIIRVLHKENPDIVHAHSAKGGFLGRLAGALTGSKNIIYTPHAFSYLSFSGIKRIIFFSLELLAIRWTDALLAISYSEAEKSIYELGFARRNVQVIPNSIPAGNPLPVQKTTGKNLKIRMIGRLTPQKNPLLFLKIAHNLLEKYPELEFTILGAGIHDDLTAEIEGYLEMHLLKKRINIQSWGTTEKSLKFLMETDIYVMTSVFEGLPYSLLEAMSMGIPCVVSCVDGNKDVINNNENGFSCVTVGDFCEKIELLVCNETFRNKIGLAGYEYVKKKHDTLVNIRHLENFYTTFTDTTPSKNPCHDNDSVLCSKHI